MVPRGFAFTIIAPRYSVEELFALKGTVQRTPPRSLAELFADIPCAPAPVFERPAYRAGESALSRSMMASRASAPAPDSSAVAALEARLAVAERRAAAALAAVEQARSDGRAEGHAKGRAEGFDEGRAEGYDEGRAEALAEHKSSSTNSQPCTATYSTGAVDEKGWKATWKARYYARLEGTVEALAETAWRNHLKGKSAPKK